MSVGQNRSYKKDRDDDDDGPALGILCLDYSIRMTKQVHVMPYSEIVYFVVLVE